MGQNSNNLKSERVQFLDFTRAIACFMVILVHACEFFYVGDIGNFSDDEIFWANFIDSALRACVPIFVMMSSYLLLPLKDELEPFLKKRFTRVLIPFVVWSILYATIPILWGGLDATGVKESLLRLTHNFNMASGHLWYIYMFIGIYLFMPIISPWLKTAKKRHIEYFLLLWFLSTFYHYIKHLTGDEFGILGQCYWNEFYTLWYFSGHLGYVVLAYYIREYLNLTTSKSLMIGLPLFLIGWAITYISFDYFYPSNGDFYTIELGWRFCTPNVAISTFALFIMFKCIKCDNAKVSTVVSDISKLSYGMYLAHIFMLNFVYSFLSEISNIPFKIISIAIVTYLLSYLLIKILSFFPKSKYIVG
ncbi:MAG: acyltransferase family protein [Rikenellaceae bacterium]